MSMHWSGWQRHRGALLGPGLLALVLSPALIAPWLPLADPTLTEPALRMLPVAAPGHWLGTDALGRDLLSRLIWGARSSILVGVLATLTAAVIGSLIGLLAGFFGRLTDALLMRGVDVLMAFPYLLLALAIVAALGPGLSNAMLAIAIANVPFFARAVRGAVLEIRHQAYIDAARLAGHREPWIIVVEVLPNLVPTLLLLMTTTLGWMVLETAGLSFLGLGVQPPDADLGAMLGEGREFLTTYPRVAVLPGMVILMLVVGINLFGDALRDLLDPRLHDRAVRRKDRAKDRGEGSEKGSEEGSDRGSERGSVKGSISDALQDVSHRDDCHQGAFADAAIRNGSSLFAALAHTDASAVAAGNAVADGLALKSVDQSYDQHADAWANVSGRLGTASQPALLEVNALSVLVPGQCGPAIAVDRLELRLQAGERVGLVGESGSGKSLTALALLGFAPPGGGLEGAVRFDGNELLGLDAESLRDLRGRRIAYIPQEPLDALDPLLRIGDQLRGAIQAHLVAQQASFESTARDRAKAVAGSDADAGSSANVGLGSKRLTGASAGVSKPETLSDVGARVKALLAMVGLDQVRGIQRRFPHELSGGQRQRVVIAMALAHEPDLLIADEATTALDVTVQAEIIEVLDRLSRSRDRALLFVSHDLALVASLCERVLVLYAGRLVEDAPLEQLLRAPAHPYTAALLACSPELGRPEKPLAAIPGQPPAPRVVGLNGAADGFGGCRFADRCPNAQPRCEEQEPGLERWQDHHWVRCWFPLLRSD
ncbi:dipeptide/oligopeptide/nickel ABC transporter permease/ATP-binding protein [Halochromatium roseum]|uniref:dipeptide/oligopeptide/nickel ABC transporter permease/ATP-binding protein n=1 Tax=Halochromatium roseum TaxID=391920 RepID=UPI001914C6D0|nr:dipeptide/oligopeptide/nickel ABC transporter permease/ATP-binding protein [Halochromatium roseum]